VNNYTNIILMEDSQYTRDRTHAYEY